ncbi:MAG: UDP-N-acetylmuramate--L-alanine ligase [Candidatus Eisenbacteria bacterium]|uniref:UDP-N-acetylmuramate--L-alanine ligase n=1 Tax=Eiseniibacteriota bacterium TaxID=2212470 RepID=A0A956RPK7_UNCEI|nr:UDP-N-acetylmuramate--L-alanine ligase [Candidatus Eisenbacteria bacterium]
MSPARVERIHFVGIGGSGMSGLAEILLTMGYMVSGSDVAESDVTSRLRSLGATVFVGHTGANVIGAQLVVVSSAVRPSNPEVRKARKLGIATLKRGEMLAEIMRLRRGIAVAGSHGKTTTTSLIGHLLSVAGLEPTVIVGGLLRRIGTNAVLGSGTHLVAEADESDRSFLDLQPTIAVVTNIDREHLDCYSGLVDIRRTFLKFMRHVPFYGLAIVCGDDPNVRALLPQMRKRVLTYGFGEENRLRASEIEPEGLAQRFVVEWNGDLFGEAQVNLPGRHNVLNALAAIAVGIELGIPQATCLQALGSFSGVGRRFELHEEVEGVLWVDDYGHHPTEIAATLATARRVFDRRLVVVFQPHRYTRTQALAREFAEVLGDLDVLFLADIYPGGEKPLPGVRSDMILDQIHALRDQTVHRVSDEVETTQAVSAVLEPGDVLLTLGAGSVSRWAPKILAAYAAKRGVPLGDLDGGGRSQARVSGSPVAPGDEPRSSDPHAREHASPGRAAESASTPRGSA